MLDIVRAEASALRGSFTPVMRSLVLRVPSTNERTSLHSTLCPFASSSSTSSFKNSAVAGFYAEPVRWKDGVIPATESLPADRQQPQLDAEVHFLLSVGQPAQKK